MAGKQPIRIRFIGDVSFNDGYIPALESGKPLFTAVKPLLEADLVVGNLECMLPGSGYNLDKVPRIETSENALESLKDLNIGLVSLATNHAYDNLETGFENTVRKLDQLGIDHLGGTLQKEKQYTPFVFEARGWRIGFLNYVHPDTNPKVSDSAQIYLNHYELDRIISDIRNLAGTTDHVIVLLHWGGKCDYGYLPHRGQIGDAKKMVEAGASAIIGHHTHTFQASMHYRKTPVYFSLGNFCFDHIRMDDQVFHVRESGRKCGVLELSFKPDGVTDDTVFPFRLKGLEPVPDHTLGREFAFWKCIFRWVRMFPGTYRFYYYLLKRWEPVYLHAQIHRLSALQLVMQKLKRMVFAK